MADISLTCDPLLRSKGITVSGTLGSVCRLTDGQPLDIYVKRGLAHIALRGAKRQR